MERYFLNKKYKNFLFWLSFVCLTQLETSSKSLYLLTLFLKTCLVAPPFLTAAITPSDLVLLSLSSKARLVTILFRVGVITDGEGDGGGGDLDDWWSDGDFGFLIIGFWIWSFLMSFLFLFPSSLFLWWEDEEFDEFGDFSFVLSSFFWLKHQLHVSHASSFGYKLLQYLCWDLNWQTLQWKSWSEKPRSPHMQHSVLLLSCSEAAVSLLDLLVVMLVMLLWYFRHRRKRDLIELIHATRRHKIRRREESGAKRPTTTNCICDKTRFRKLAAYKNGAFLIASIHFI